MFSRIGIAMAIALSVVIPTSVANAYTDVVIDPGHCVTWAGNDGYGGPQGINESVRTLQIGHELEWLLAYDLEYMVYMTRNYESCLDPNNYQQDVLMRPRYANGTGPNAEGYYIDAWVDIDVFISIHLDSNADQSIDYTRSYYKHSLFSTLASKMTDNIVEYIDNFWVYVPDEGIDFTYDATHNGILQTNEYAVLNYLDETIPGCLAEALAKKTRESGLL